MNQEYFMHRGGLWGICLSALFASTANAALWSRAGGQAYYDDALDITWTANANLAATESFGLPRNIGYPNSNGNDPIENGEVGPQGEMSWYTAQLWISAMNSAAYLGQTGWRLPNVSPVNGIAFNTAYSDSGETDSGVNISAAGTLYAGSTASELANLYYTTLGNPGGYYTWPGANCITLPVQTFIPSCLQTVGPFSNVLERYYWTGLPYLDGGKSTWVFSFAGGWQGSMWTNTWISSQPSEGGIQTWAVLDGDPLSSVPVPSAVWLFSGALGALGAVRRKAKALTNLVSGNRRRRESMRKKIFLGIAFSMLAPAMSTVEASTVITFDEPEVVWNENLHSFSVSGITFANAQTAIGIHRPTGLFSSPIVGLYVNSGIPLIVTMTDGASFDFIGAAFSSTQVPWLPGCGGYCYRQATVTLRGFRDDLLSYEATDVPAPFLSPTFADMNWTDIDRLDITYTQPPPGWALGDGYTVMDDFTFQASAVPVPAAVWLFGGALGALGWIRRTQAKA